MNETQSNLPLKRVDTTYLTPRTEMIGKKDAIFKYGGKTWTHLNRMGVILRRQIQKIYNFVRSISEKRQLTSNHVLKVMEDNVRNMEAFADELIAKGENVKSFKALTDGISQTEESIKILFECVHRTKEIKRCRELQEKIAHLHDKKSNIEEMSHIKKAVKELDGRCESLERSAKKTLTPFQLKKIEQLKKEIEAQKEKIALLIQNSSVHSDQHVLHYAKEELQLAERLLTKLSDLKKTSAAIIIQRFMRKRLKKPEKPKRTVATSLQSIVDKYEQMQASAGITSGSAPPMLAKTTQKKLNKDEWELLTFQLKKKPEHYSAKDFNDIADLLKTNRNWKIDIQNMMSSTNSREKIHKQRLEIMLDAFTGQPLTYYRGYDREVLSVILVNLSAAAAILYQKRKKPDKLAQLDAMIAHFNDTAIFDNVELKPLGKGKVNTVFEFTKDNVSYVFKPASEHLSQSTKLKEKYIGTAVASGIPAGDEGHFSSRAVASSCLDCLLYGVKTVSVKTRHAVINGQRGILMVKAMGKNPKTTKIESKPIQLNETYRKMISRLITPNEAAAKALHRTQQVPKEKLQSIAAMLQLRSVSFEFTKAKTEQNKIEWQLFGVRPQFEHFDPFNPKILEGLLKLQVKDIIAGECDRHPKNYFIDPKGNVTGIDEDCCFGERAIPGALSRLEETPDVRRQGNLAGVIPNQGSLMLRMPGVITQEILDQINRCTAKDLSQTLRPYITQRELEATIARFTKLKQHVNDANKCLVVKKIEDLFLKDLKTKPNEVSPTEESSYQQQPTDILTREAIQRVDANNSYWAREYYLFDSAQTNWNYLRRGL